MYVCKKGYIYKTCILNSFSSLLNFFLYFKHKFYNFAGTSSSIKKIKIKKRFWWVQKKRIEICFSLQFLFGVMFARTFYRMIIFGCELTLLKFLHAHKGCNKCWAELKQRVIKSQKKKNTQHNPRDDLEITDLSCWMHEYVFHLIMLHNILWHYCNYDT